jgi:predicted DNA-binding antitoxin AbrB/MazE fold protein
MQAIVATFKDGVFMPAEPVRLPEGFQVTLWVDPTAQPVETLREEDRAFLRQLAVERAEVFRRLAE